MQSYRRGVVMRSSVCNFQFESYFIGPFSNVMLGFNARAKLFLLFTCARRRIIGEQYDQ